MIIYPYKSGSKSVAALKEALNIKAINVKGKSNFKGNPKKLVVNWGNSKVTEEINKCTVVNHPDAVAIASNKKTFFNTVKGKVNIPEFTTNKNKAFEWLKDGKIIVVRELLTGNSGAGIVILDTIEAWNSYSHNKSKMYVQYVPKKDEYRIHVSAGKVIDKQRKAKKAHLLKGQVDWRIRNHHNGFVFVRGGVKPPQCVIDSAIKSVQLCGLDFGAVDVIYNQYHKKAYVLEINTAPGLEGSTVDSYEESFNHIETKFLKEIGVYEAQENPKVNFKSFSPWNKIEFEQGGAAGGAGADHIIVDKNFMDIEVNHGDEDLNQ